MNMILVLAYVRACVCIVRLVDRVGLFALHVSQYIGICMTNDVPNDVLHDPILPCYKTK